MTEENRPYLTEEGSASASAKLGSAASSRSAQTLETYCSTGLFAIAGAMLLFYLFVSYPSQMHSDSAMKLLLGERMKDSISLLPRDWYYINDIWIIFPNIIAAPLLLFAQPSMLLHGIVDAIAAAAVLWVAYLAARAAGVRGGLRYFVATLLACGLSLAFVEMVFGQSAYSSTMFTLLLLAGSGARFLATQDFGNAGTRRRDTLIIGILLIISVASGPRGLAIYAAPLLFAAAGMFLFSARDARLRSASQRLFVTVLLATIIGGLLFLFELRFVKYTAGAAAQAFAAPAAIGNHLRLIVMNWLTIFDALPPAGQRFDPVLGGIYAARFGIAALVFLTPLTLLLRFGRLESTELKFLVLFHAGLSATTIYMLVFTGLIVDEDSGVPRYLMPLVPTALLVVALWLQAMCATWGMSATHAGWAIIMVMLSLSPRQLVGSAFVQWPHFSAGMRANPRAQLVEVLKNAGLHRGYAEYWNAGALSILSGGDVRVAPIVLDESGLPVPFRYLGSEQWYEPNWATGSTFLILDSAGRARTNMAALAAALGSPAQTLHAGEFEVLVFSSNLAEKLGFGLVKPAQRPLVSAGLCAAGFEVDQSELTLKTGQFGVLGVHAKNRSGFPWARTSVPGFNPGLRIIASNGRKVADMRAALPQLVPPGSSVDLPIAFRAPDKAGTYTLYFSFVAEGETWCGDLGAGWAKAQLTVSP